MTKQQNFVSFSIYVSRENDPLYIEQCTLIRKIGIHVLVNLMNRTLCVMMSFGLTELIVQAYVLETGESAGGHFST